jgi:predicted transcriptional regulator of viral defense system
MVNLKLLRDLGRYPVFTVRQMAGIADKDMDYAYLMAHRMKKAGLIHELEKGKYTIEEDPFIVASWIVWPSYISGWAALGFYKLTEQLPFTIHVVTTVKRKNKVIPFRDSRIEFLTFNKERFCGFSKRIYRNRTIFIAGKEKAIVDALAGKKMSFDEAAELVKNNKGKINLAQLFGYGKSVRGLNNKLKALVYD